ncbi:MAG: N-acetylornithine carbamoyltransferase [Planctomycetes bacterium]|nr:N-acetylornithine carbamoyltransferase [Planctomycetota bacterium]
MTTDIRGRDFLRLADFEISEINDILDLAAEMKREQRHWSLRGRTIIMLFFNSSLRTRTSFEIGAAQLQAHPVVLNVGQDAWNLEWREGVVMNGDSPEHIKDAARTLSRYGDALAVRSFPKLKSYEEDRTDPILSSFAKYASLPLVNLESAVEHPCQGLADLMTLREIFNQKTRRKKVVLSWAPHVKPLPLAVPHSFLLAAAMGGCDVTVAHPPKFELAPEVMEQAQQIAAKSGGTVKVSHNQDEAFKGAEVIYAKSWLSREYYGKPVEEFAYRNTLPSWTVSESKMGQTNRAKFMHCLPIRRNVVATDGVLDDDDCVIYQQAENRLHAQKALLVKLLGESSS